MYWATGKYPRPLERTENDYQKPHPQGEVETDAVEPEEGFKAGNAYRERESYPDL